MKNKIKRLVGYLQYLYFHKIIFGITNTKRDISYCVFRESFLRDQYGIRKFLTKFNSIEKLFFLDIGRNHGFVFYYTVYFLMKNNIKVSEINYYGIDPSPLKFVYFNFHDYLTKNNIVINYHIIDKAVVFNGEEKVVLKYGENNFGNFHVSGSNFYNGSKENQSKFEYVNIEVDTIQFDDLFYILDKNINDDVFIVKIDNKNKTSFSFTKMLEYFEKTDVNYLISCEYDNSSEKDVSQYKVPNENSLSTFRYKR